MSDDYKKSVYRSAQADENRNSSSGNDEGKKLRRRLWRRYKYLLWLLVIVPLVVFVVQVMLVMAPRMQYEIAVQHTMTDSIEVTGQVVMNSQTVSGGAGYPYYIVPSGQRVAAGAEVAYIFNTAAGAEAQDSIAAIDAELESLVDAQDTIAQGGDMENLLGDLQNGLFGVLDSIESGNYSHLQQSKNEMSLAANKMQIAAGETENFEERIAYLNDLKTQYQSLAQPVATVTAPAVGYFIPSSLNDAKAMDYETIEALSPKSLQEALKKPPVYYGNDVAGHIVSDFKWHFYTTVSAKEAEKFYVGDTSLHLSFPDRGDITVPVEVEAVEIDEENNVAKIQLYCEYVSPEVMQLRVEQANIIFSSIKGLRISKKALRLVDVTNPDGSVNTYKGVYVEFGNMIYFKKVDIIMEDDFYFIIPLTKEKGKNEVELYDKIVVDSGGVELYDNKIL